MAAALVLVSTQLAAVPASAAPVAVAKVATQRMTDATLNSTQVGWYSAGSHLTLICYKRGQAVKGYFSPWIPGGWDDLWYKVSDGYFVADVDIETGSNNPVTAACSTPPPPPPPPSGPTGVVRDTTQRMSDATLNSVQVGWYSVGSTLSLSCYKRGQPVKGYFSPWITGGWDDLWYKVSDGYFVADVDIETGSNNPVTGACAAPAPTPPPSTPPPPAPPAPSAPTGIVRDTTQRMSDATLNSVQVGWYSVGSRLTLSCYKRGQAVKGYYSPYIPGGWDDLWYKVSDGYFVADVDIDTGSNNPVTGQCASAVVRVTPPPVTPPAPPPVSNPSTGARTVKTLTTTYVRSGATSSSLILGLLTMGATVTITCHVRGQNIGGSNIWNRLSTGGYVPDSALLTGSNNPVVPVCGAYNRAAAVAWAKAHYNDAERYKKNDCTWFVSSALWVGNLPQTAHWSGGYLPPIRAVNADYLKNYLVTESRQATIQELSWGQNNVPQAQLGDIIAYDWGVIKDGEWYQGTDGIIDHMMIITGFSGQYPLVSGHTAPAIDQGWTWSNGSQKWYSQVFPGSRPYLIHITV